LVSSRRSSEDDICLFAKDSRNCMVKYVSTYFVGFALRVHVQLGACLAKIPSRSPYPRKGSPAHDVRIYSVVLAGLSQEGISHQIQSEREPRIVAEQLGSLAR
jgi:hypothetical protein